MREERSDELKAERARLRGLVASRQHLRHTPSNVESTTSQRGHQRAARLQGAARRGQEVSTYLVGRFVTVADVDDDKTSLVAG